MIRPHRFPPPPHLSPRPSLHLHLPRSHSTTSPRPLKLAIIGAGPSGFYCASRILSSLPPSSPNGQNTRVHMYERLPTPYGLVRYGVAPDHPEVKNCQHKFDELSADERFLFLGNTSVGTQPSSLPDTPASPSPATTLSPYTYPHAVHVPFSALAPHYNAILLTYGASLSNTLASVPGASSSPRALDGVFPALAFVSWYNGHPAFAGRAPALDGVQHVTVVGQGNVALDCARILLKAPADLAETDVPEEVLEVLGKAGVREVSVVGRRGPGQVAFTTKELREMVRLPGVRYGGVEAGLVEEARGMVQGDRMRKRMLGIMQEANAGSGADASGSGVWVEGGKRFNLDFQKSPKAFLPRAGEAERVGGVEWELNELLAPPPALPEPPASQGQSVPESAVVARPTGRRVRTRTDMVIESVGYRSEPLALGEGGWQLPFDVARGRVRNIGGRVVDELGIPVAGMYAGGWAARGPVGVIAATMHDAYSLAALILEDHFASPRPSPGSPLGRVPEDGLPDGVERGRREGRVVELAGWRRIDEAERERARRRGSKKEREKFTTVEEMLAVLA